MKEKNIWNYIAILLVFSINGSFATFIVRPILNLIGVNKTNLPTILYYFLYIFPVIVIYQLTLPLVGWLFGQYQFFTTMQTKTTGRILKIFKSKK